MNCLPCPLSLNFVASCTISCGMTTLYHNGAGQPADTIAHAQSIKVKVQRCVTIITLSRHCCLANMEVSVHRCCLSRTLLYSVIFSSLLAWILSFSRSQHDGRTVTLMLAKLGEGPLLLDRDQGRNRSSVTMDGAEIDCE